MPKHNTVRSKSPPVVNPSFADIVVGTMFDWKGSYYMKTKRNSCGWREIAILLTTGEAVYFDDTTRVQVETYLTIEA